MSEVTPLGNYIKQASLQASLLAKQKAEEEWRMQNCTDCVFCGHERMVRDRLQGRLFKWYCNFPGEVRNAEKMEYCFRKRRT